MSGAGRARGIGQRRWRWLLSAVAVIGVAVSSWALGRGMQSPKEAASRAAAPVASWVTVAVEQRVLSQTLITRGVVRPQAEVRVRVPASVGGDAVVTNAPVATGDEVVEGERLIEVSGRPVFVLQGQVPAYRSLKPGMNGVDVSQLQSAMVRLGCAVRDKPGVYGATTEQCVAWMYRSAGYEPESASATDAGDLAPTGGTVAQGEIVFVPALPARVLSAPTGVGPIASAEGQVKGPTAASPSEIVRLSSGRLVAAVTFRPDERALVRVQMPVELLDEASNTTYRATIAALDDTATMGDDGQPSFAGVVTPTDESPLPYEAAGVSLRVTITAASTTTETLVVPVTAVSSAADGSTFVSVVPHGSLVTTDPSVVPVKASLSADGFVAVEPIDARSLKVGDRVVVGR